MPQLKTSLVPKSIEDKEKKKKRSLPRFETGLVPKSSEDQKKGLHRN